MDIALTAGQYSLVYNALSLVFATMAGAGLFFWGVRKDVAPKYRVGVVVSAVVVFIAAYHYLRIWQSWGGAPWSLTVSCRRRFSWNFRL